MPDTRNDDMDRKRWFVLFLAVMFLMACASAVPTSPDKDVHPPKTVPAIKEKDIGDRSVSDMDLFHDAVSFLDNPEVTADYLRARSAFELLVRNYPKSKWRNLSETFIRIIDDIQAYQAKSRSDQLLLDKAQADKGRLLQESEQLKKEIRLLNDKHQTETTRLLQENEQLKKDIQLLKNLEIQLEKRERTLR
jgi:gas vesicle protein